MKSSGKMSIAGGGLVGSLLALFLARKGYDIDLFEKRMDLRKRETSLTVGEGRSINLAISARGLHALSLLGLKEKVLEFCIPMRGRMVHDQKGLTSFLAYGKSDKDAINSLSRSWLNAFLLNEAEKTGKIHFSFEHEIQDVDFANKNLKFINKTIPYDILFGTDGSASRIRQKMQSEKILELSSEELSHGYKEFVMSPLPGGKFRMEANALHIWPRGDFMLIALPNFDGSFTCTFFLRNRQNKAEEMSFAQLKSENQIKNFFLEYFPDFTLHVPDYCQQFKENQLGRMVTVKSTPWYHPKYANSVCLLGDAAHAIVPFFGQGMNCGFEDVVDLIENLETSLSQGFQSYFAKRKPNTDAIADMAVENFVEMSAKVADQRFLFKKQVEKFLQEKFPSSYVSRYSLVSFSRTPYATAKKIGEIQDEILDELTQGIGSVSELPLDLAQKLIENKLSTFKAEIQRNALDQN